MLLIAISLLLGAERVGSLPPYNWPGDKGRAAVVGPSGSIAWRFAVTASVNVLDYGADNTCATDVAGIVNTLLTSLPFGTGGEIVFPTGCYRFSSTVRIGRNVYIHGVGGGMTRNATVIKPDNGVTAFEVDGPNNSPDGGAGDESLLSSFDIEYTQGQIAGWQSGHSYASGALVYSVANVNYARVFQAQNSGTSAGSEPAWSALVESATIPDGGVTWKAIVVAGVRLVARAHVERVLVNYAPGNAVHIEATTSATGPTGTPRANSNANGFHLSDLQLFNGYANGLFVQGSDANAGYGEAIDLEANRLWGIYENSFLGNTYSACQAAVNGAGAYASLDFNATNMFLNCYSESGYPGSLIHHPAEVIGGQHGAGFVSGTDAMIIDGQSIIGATIFRPLTSTSHMFANLTAGDNYAINFSNDDEGASYGYTLGTPEIAPGGHAGWWGWRHQNSDAKLFMEWSGAGAAEGAGRIWFVRGAYFGDKNHRIQLLTGESKPAGSTWVTPVYQDGDLMLNTSLVPQAGFTHGVLGWQNISQDASLATVQTIRWPNFGFANEFDLTTNPVGSPLVYDYTEHSGVTFANVGATGKQYVSLPGGGGFPDKRMTEFGGYIDNSNGLRFTATGGLAFKVGAASTATNGYMESTSAGSTMRVKLMGGVTTPTWEVMSIHGSWTDGTSTFGSCDVSGCTMTGTLTASSGLTVSSGQSTFNTQSNFNGAVELNGSTFINGGSLNWRGANGQNVVTLPTGLSAAFRMKDTDGNIYIAADTVAGDAQLVSIGNALNVGGNTVVTGHLTGGNVHSNNGYFYADGGGAFFTFTKTSVAGDYVFQDSNGKPYFSFDTNTSAGGVSLPVNLTAAGGVTIATGPLKFTSATNDYPTAAAPGNGILVPSDMTQAFCIGPTNVGGRCYVSMDTHNQILTLGSDSPSIAFSGSINVANHSMSSVGLLTGNGSGAGMQLVGNAGLSPAICIGIDSSSPTCDVALQQSGGKSWADINAVHNIKFNGATLNNVITVPTGETAALVLNDAAGNWYAHVDSQNVNWSIDATVGFSAPVYFNNGTSVYNAGSGANIIACPNSVAECLDVKDSGGTYLQVFNSITKSIALHGTNTNDSASAGYVGEVVKSCVTAASGTVLSNNTAANVTPITLTAGDWMVDVKCGLTGTSTGTDFQCGWSTTSATMPGASLKGDTWLEEPSVSSAAADDSISVPGVHVQASTTITGYGVGQATFSVGAPLLYGCVVAQRIR